jgi:hypothetical protein
MPLQSLHNLLRLQIPYINLLILAPTHNPLAPRDTKTAKDAVLGITVTRVSLEAFRGGVAPEAEGVVERRGQYVFAVG